MASLRESIEQMVLSTAYHEAGHVVAAVLQGLPLLEGGIHIDLEGSGVANYCHRKPGEFDRLGDRAGEREKTIIALYAGRVAQANFLPEFDELDSWKSDRDTADKLLQELSPTAPDSIRQELYRRAEQLVLENWRTVDGLALRLWEKPIAPMQPAELSKGWSQARGRREKMMTGAEVRGFFMNLQIPCTLSKEH